MIEKHSKMRMGFLAVILIALCLVAIAMVNNVKRPAPSPSPTTQTPQPSPTPTPAPQPAPSATSDKPFTLQPGQSFALMGGGFVALDAINDSRCKPGVVCIWAGELAAEVRYTDGTGVVTTLHLGTTTKSCDRGLTLQSITETSATFIKAATCVTE
jgi:hypothetical protein